VTRSTTIVADAPALDAARWRADFPALQQQVHGHPLVYLDNAATTQKPRIVLDALRRYYEQDNANIHRGVHALSVRATAAYEHARRRAQEFIGAREPSEIVFVRGATEAVNLVAQTYGRTHVRAGDEILLTHMEHLSNIVPWQLLCEESGAVLRVAPINDAGELIWEEFERLLTPRTRLVAVVHVSNALGTVNPVRDIAARAHGVGAAVLVDGAQAVPHMPVDVQALDCDFYAFSGHKLYGPTGIGVLYGRRALLDALPPYQGGGEMIRSVSFAQTTYNATPHKFEAGTPHIAGAIGLAAAIDYVETLGLPAIAAYERDLLAYATRALRQLPEVQLVGTAAEKAGVVSFNLAGIHPHDVGTLLDQRGIAVRAGHHCAQPVMERFGVPATCRASLALYNQEADVDALVEGLRHVLKVFAA
jgi:cysteine desulfurase/selenocysteine lyase